MCSSSKKTSCAAVTAQGVLDPTHCQEVHWQEMRQGACLPPTGCRQEVSSLGGLPYKVLTNVICGHHLGIPATILANVHHPGQNVLRPASVLGQRLW